MTIKLQCNFNVDLVMIWEIPESSLLLLSGLAEAGGVVGLPLIKSFVTRVRYPRSSYVRWSHGHFALQMEFLWTY